ncbi:MAG: sialate O-acetylesterase [Planctomycetota bacterium]
MRLIPILLAVCCLASTGALHAQPEDPPVRVFIMAGQSNMEGKAQNKLLEFQANDPATAELFSQYRDGGQWVTRTDVRINYLDRRGGLTIGYGSRNRTGCELAFGWTLGDHFDEPVLLIKAAWGGHSLYKLFRPPSAGMPSDEFLANELAQRQERVRHDNERHNRDNPLPTMDDIIAEYGSSYRNMLDEVRTALAELDERFPELAGREVELCGFVWFQGWNDQYGELAPGEYESNMQHFINDVRRDLEAPDLPFVIGAMGQNGSSEPQGNMLVVRNAQLAMNEVPEFEGNVKTILTDVLVDTAAEELYPTWRDNIEAWERVGSDHAYHYLGSAIWFNRIGEAFAQAMLELMDEGAD